MPGRALILTTRSVEERGVTGDQASVFGELLCEYRRAAGLTQEARAAHFRPRPLRRTEVSATRGGHELCRAEARAGRGAAVARQDAVAHAGRPGWDRQNAPGAASRRRGGRVRGG